jgi:hypothetical protein
VLRQTEITSPALCQPVRVTMCAIVTNGVEGDAPDAASAVQRLGQAAIGAVIVEAAAAANRPVEDLPDGERQEVPILGEHRTHGIEQRPSFRLRLPRSEAADAGRAAGRCHAASSATARRKLGKFGSIRSCRSPARY